MRLFGIKIVLIFLLIAPYAHTQDQLSSSQIVELEEKAATCAQNNQYNDAVYFLSKISFYYWQDGNSQKAAQYFEKTLEQALKTNNINGIANIYARLGDTYLDLQEYDKAEKNYDKSRELRKKLGQQKAYIEATLNASEAKSAAGKLKESIQLLDEIKAPILESGDKEQQRSLFSRLAENYGRLNNSEKQAEYFALYQGLDRDIQKKKMESIQKETSKKIGDIKQQAYNEISQKNSELKMTSDQLSQERRLNSERMLQIKLLKMENDNQELKLREQATKLQLQTWINVSLSVGSLLLLFLTISLYMGYKQKKRANDQINKQKQEIELQNKELEAKNSELLELNHEKNYIIGIVAHDLKAPLNNIRGLLEIIKLVPENLSPDQMKYVDIMMKSIDRVKSMISRILDVNAIESKDLQLEIKSIDVADVVRNVIFEVNETAQLKKISIKTQFENKRYHALVDPDLFYQVIENLVTNAIKFSPFEKEVLIRLEQEESNIKTHVIDHGPGIESSERDKLFKKFQKLSARPTNGESSTGLGLSIVKRYVNAMGGQIECQSEYGKGCDFIVTMPSAASDNKEVKVKKLERAI